MPNALKPEREFCASCGFPIRGHRCDTCGRGREPLPLEEGRRQPAVIEGEVFDITGLERAFEALRAQDLPRCVGIVLTVEGGDSVRSLALPDGPGWAALIRGAPVFTAINTETAELSVEAPLVRVPRVQRTAVLRLALELCAQELVAARIALRDDLLLLRIATKLNAQNPITLRHLLREVGSLAARYTELFAVGFDARPAISEEQQSSAGFDALGRSKRLRFGPGTNRGNAPAASKAALAAARRAQAAAAPPREAEAVTRQRPATLRDTDAAPSPRAASPRDTETPSLPRPVSLRDAETPPLPPREEEAASSPRSAPPREAEAASIPRSAPPREAEAASIPRSAPRPSEAPTRPAMRSSSAPPPPLGVELSARLGDGMGPIELHEARRPEVVTTPIRRVPALPAVPQMPAARASDSSPPPRPSRPSAPPAPALAAASSGEGMAPRIHEDRKRNAQTMPEPNRRALAPAAAGAVLSPARPSARPMLELEAPSRRPSTLIPAVTGENALLPADRLAAMLRQAQGLASLMLDMRPASLSWLVRATVFRAVYEYRDALPDAVAHLYRCTGIGRDTHEPALLVMERIAAARCQVAAEKPLSIDPFTTAPQAKEHVARYIVEIERCSIDMTLRHFLALGGLSELLVRAKLPAQTEQRLREIVTFAQREGAKASAFDLMMTSLQRISGG